MDCGQIPSPITWNMPGPGYCECGFGIFHKWRYGRLANAISTNTVAYSAGSYSWTIPNAISRHSVRVKVADHLDSTVYSTSANFTIKGSLTVTSPTGGASLGGRVTTHNITWTKTGTISTVKLAYSTDGFSDGSQTVQITASVNATLGTPYAWTIPDAISSTVKVRVTDNADTTVSEYFSCRF